MTTTADALRRSLSDSYRIERELGAGGMATVYLAHDLKHDRQVAIKVLRPELAAVIGAERFLAEIKTTANLQHPHILPLHDSGEVNGTVYYVMPYVEGESLRDRLTREKQLPISDAVRIATEIASALDYAHRHGVIHRDIKPENILLHDGAALVADFGIALAVSRSDGASRMTETGLSLGTPTYMSPEQAMGERDLDARTDVYALGAMLYEMLLGEPPFTGPTAQAIVAKVMTEKPAPLAARRERIPAYVEDAVLTALEKLPADRFHSAAEFAGAISGATTTPAPRDRSRPPLGGRRALRSWQWPVAGLVLLAIGLVAGWTLKSRAGGNARRDVTRFALAMGQPGGSSIYLDLSPDGRRIALSGEIGPDQQGVLVRNLASSDVVRIAGTDGGRLATFSTDGEWLSFNRDHVLLKVPSRGGPSVTLSEDALDGGAWMPDGSIVYTRASDFGLSSIASSGGQSRSLTSLDVARGEWAHWRPQPLPGGQVALFTNYAIPIGRSRIETIDLRSGARTVVQENAVNGRYAPGGHLLFVRDGTVFAIAFDPGTLTTSGDAVPVLEDVFWNPTLGQAAYAVAPDGTLAYVSATAWATQARVLWVDRDGRERDALPTPGKYSEPRLSPDGRWIAVTIREAYPTLGFFEVGRGILTTVEGHPGAVFSAVWAPDGRSVLCSWEARAYDIYSVRADNSVPPRAVVESPYDKNPTSISPAAGLMVYVETVRRDNRIMLAPLDGRRPPWQLDSTASGNQPALSPDGRWVAFAAEARGREEVFVRATDGSGARIQVSIAGGTEPRFSRGGREIVFRHGDAMMSVAADPAAGSFSAPVVLFRGPYDHATTIDVHRYDVSPDGNRFLMVKPVERPDALPIVVVLNWVEELKTRMAR